MTLKVSSFASTGGFGFHNNVLCQVRTVEHDSQDLSQNNKDSLEASHKVQEVHQKIQKLREQVRLFYTHTVFVSISLQPH